MHQRGYLDCNLKSNVLVAQKKYKDVYKHIAPQVLKGFPVTPASDIYSLGRGLTAIAKNINSTILLQLGKAATDINLK